jgi:hypothetical protein
MLGKPALTASYGNLPFYFEPNQGQAEPQVQFLSRGLGYQFFLTPAEAVFTFNRAEKDKGPFARPPHADPREGPVGRSAPFQSDVLRLRITGGNRKALFRGLEPTGGMSNYITGNEPGRWRKDIPQYARVRMEGVYPGVDLEYHGHPLGGPGKLEYDFVAAPGADPSQIRLAYTGCGKAELDAQGNLSFPLPGGKVAFQAPVAYQLAEGKRIPVESRYVLEAGNAIGFKLGAYDPSRPLVIDPTLLYSTYLGGTGDDVIDGIAVDGAGNAYVTGYTTGGFPTTDGTNNPSVFVAKVNPTGTGLVYSTTLGGSAINVTRATGIAVDSAGNAYLSGYTNGTFPTAGGANFGAVSALDYGFAAKLSTTGTLVYSGYFGGAANSKDTYCMAIAVDSTGAAYATGYTAGGVSVTSGAYITTQSSAVYEPFVAKIIPAGTGLAYCTYLGGQGWTYGFGIAVNASGNAFVTGYTESGGFPTTSGAYETTGSFSPFLVELNPAGSGVSYSTYLGGGVMAYAKSVTMDSSGNAFVAGSALAGAPTTPGSFQPSITGSRYDAYFAEVNPTGTGLVYATYLGDPSPSADTNAYGIALGSSDTVYLTGGTGSPNFPTTPDAIQTALGSAGSNAWMTVLNPLGGGSSDLVYSTYLGGNSSCSGLGIAVDSSGNPYVAGQTGAGFPTTPGAAQTVNGGGTDGFVMKFSLVTLPTATPTNSPTGTLTPPTSTPTLTTTPTLTPTSTVSLTFTPAGSPSSPTPPGTPSPPPVSTATPTATPSYSPTGSPTATVIVNLGSAQCLVSDTTHNLMYYNTGNCSPVTQQITPPPDSGSLSWLDPNYNTASVATWAAPVSSFVAQWVSPCNLTGSTSNTMWIGWDGGGNNPCGDSTGYVTDEYFRNVFTLAPGCAVTAAILTVSEDNWVDAWLNGVQVGPTAIGGFGNCTQIVVPPSLFRTGNNVLAFDAINGPYYPGSGWNPQGLTYEMCYNLSCTGAATSTPTATPTLTSTISPTPTGGTAGPTTTLTATPSSSPTPTLTLTATNTLTAPPSGTPTNSPTTVPTVCVASVATLTGGSGGAFNGTDGVDTDGTYLYEADWAANQIQVFQYSNNAPVTSYPVTSPIGMRKGPGNYLYVASNTTNQILVMNPLTGAAVTSIGAGLLNDPRALEFDASWNLFAGSYGSNRVLEFTQTAGVWSASATIGTSVLTNAEAVGIDAAGNIYVGDASNHRIEVFNHDGSNPRAWGTGLFTQDIQEIRFDGNGNLWVDDRQGNRALEFDTGGNLIGILGPPAGSLTLQSVSGVAIGPDGELVLGEAEPDNRVDRFTLCTPLPTATITETPTITPTPTMTLSPTLSPTPTSSPSATLTATPPSTPSATSTAVPTAFGGGTQCLVSDTTHNLMYFNTANCSGVTLQPTPPPDSGNLSWLDPNYNTASAGNWAAPVAASVGGWISPCNLAGSTSNTAWIGYDAAGDNPCGTTGNVVTEYFRNVFTLPAGCAVTAANLTLAVDNDCLVWLNGILEASDTTGGFTACDTYSIPVSAFQTGVNVLAFEVINAPIPAGQTNPQGLTYEMCYTATCGTFTATPANTLTATPSSTPTGSPTWSPTSTVTSGPTATMTATVSPTSTLSPTSTPTLSPTSTPSASPSWTPTATNTLRSRFLTPTPTPTATVSTVEIGPPYPNPVRGQGSISIDVAAPGLSEAGWSVYTTAFRRIAWATQPVAGSATLHWDLTDKAGVRVANGLYYLKVVVASGGTATQKILKLIVLDR